MQISLFMHHSGRLADFLSKILSHTQCSLLLCSTLNSTNVVQVGEVSKLQDRGWGSKMPLVVSDLVCDHLRNLNIRMLK